MEKVKNSDNTRLKEKVQTISKTKAQDETASFEKPDSKGKGVKWPIVAGSACLVISISSFAAVRIRKKSKSK